MKNACKWIACLFCMIASVQPLWAKDKTVVAVLPFTTHSAENIDYVRQGVLNMISSRISVNEKIEVVGRDVIQDALNELGKKEPAPADFAVLGKKLNADFVVWGSITKIGSGLSIDGRLIDAASSKTATAIAVLCRNMDEVIPKVTDFAQKIESHILGTPSQAAEPPSAPAESTVARESAPRISREELIISGMKDNRQGTFTSAINPAFINASEPFNRKTFWKSQQFSTELRGMDIGDVDGDGLNETVMIDHSSISIYRKKDDEFRLIQKIPGKSYDNYISVDVADINRNGIKEIIVSNYHQRIISSFIIEFKNGQYLTVASDLRWFMRVIDNSSGIPLLLGQRMGVEKPFETPIYEIISRNGEYREGRKMRIPEGLSVYGLTLEKLGTAGPERIISLSADDHLYVFEQTDKPLSKVAVFGGSNEFIWKSDDLFGGSNTYIDPVSQSIGLKSVDDQEINFINLRIVTYDVNKDGKQEFIIVKNLSSASRLLGRLKLFSAAEVYDLEWDGGEAGSQLWGGDCRRGRGWLGGDLALRGNGVDGPSAPDGECRLHCPAHRVVDGFPSKAQRTVTGD